MRTLDDLTRFIREHRCFTHPIFHHWADVQPEPRTIGALFHQIQCFCASTRPGWSLPDALQQHGMAHESHLLNEIVESEEDHGPELATMAGHIVNRAAGRRLIADLADQEAVEAFLKTCSDELLGHLPGYEKGSGLTVQARHAIAVFDRRKQEDRESTVWNLGAALALELISNRHLIPGEKHCLVDSGLYAADLAEAEMHYLLEHFGETGAEEQHEKNAAEAVGRIISEETEPLLFEGAAAFLDNLAGLWDLLDAALLHSGMVDGQPAVRANGAKATAAVSG